MAVFLLNIVWHCYETTITLAQEHRSSGWADGVKTCWRNWKLNKKDLPIMFV